MSVVLSNDEIIKCLNVPQNIPSEPMYLLTEYVLIGATMKPVFSQISDQINR